MPRLLHIAASPRTDDSHSRRAADMVIRHWRERYPNLDVVCRDLAATPIPHPDASFAAASLRQPSLRSDADDAALALSETMIGELDAADAVLISTPMHNFSIPSVLKAWIDLVVRPGRTFHLTSTGKKGALRNRPVRVVMACGGSPRWQKDWATPYLSYVFGIIGLDDFDSYALERCNREQTLDGQLESKLETWLSNTPIMNHH